MSAKGLLNEKLATVGELMLLHYSFGKYIVQAEACLLDAKLTLDSMKHVHRKLGLIINPKDLNPAHAIAKLNAASDSTRTNHNATG